MPELRTLASDILEFLAYYVRLTSEVPARYAIGAKNGENYHSLGRDKGGRPCHPFSQSQPSSVQVQKEMISGLPEILCDDRHEDVCTLLLDHISTLDLVPCILEALSELSLSQKMLGENP